MAPALVEAACDFPASASIPSVIRLSQDSPARRVTSAGGVNLGSGGFS